MTKRTNRAARIAAELLANRPVLALSNFLLSRDIRDRYRCPRRLAQAAVAIARRHAACR